MRDRGDRGRDRSGTTSDSFGGDSNNTTPSKYGLGSKYGPNCACSLKEWVYRINKFAEEEMNDYIENIGAYLENQTPDYSPLSDRGGGGTAACATAERVLQVEIRIIQMN